MAVHKFFSQRILALGMMMNLIIPAFAQQGDTIKRAEINSMHIYELRNGWLSTSNAAGITFNKGKGPGFLDVNYQSMNGDYHLVREGSNIHSMGLSTASYTQLGKINFYGAFSYNNLNEKETRWIGVWNPKGESPLIIGDSIGGDFVKESYTLKGVIGSTSQNDKLHWGIGVNYKSGSGAKDKDPRPKNFLMLIEFSPGVIYQIGKVNMGIALNYSQKKQEIDYKCELDENQTLFKFLGMGFYDDLEDSKFYRKYVEDKYQGAFQFQMPLFETINNMTEVYYQVSKQSVEDGKNIVANGGDFKVKNMGVKSTMGRTCNLSIQKLTLMASMSEADTWSYEQELKEVIDGKVQWVTFAKNRKFNRKSYSAGVRYEYLRLRNSQSQDWGIVASANIKNKKETYYNIPGIFKTQYNRLDVHGQGEKNFRVKSHLLGLGASLSYAKNLTAQEEIPFKGKNYSIQREVARQDFYYEAAGYTAWGVNASWQFPVRIKNSSQNLYMKASFTQYSPESGYWINEKRNCLNLNLGMVF